MSETALQNLLVLCKSIDQNGPCVEERLRRAGVDPDPVIVESVAKYWDALEKLAAE